MKYYAVKKGKTPGVYTTWSDCQAQTKGFSGAVFKSFATLTEAVEFCSVTLESKQNSTEHQEQKYTSTFYTDGSYTDGSAGGACYNVEKDTVVYGRVPGDEQTNNRGELFGIWLALCQMQDGEHIQINTDSQYCINVLTGTYKSTKNLDMIGKIQKEMSKGVVHFKYVPAHTGIPGNEIADMYANKGRFLQGTKIADNVRESMR